MTAPQRPKTQVGVEMNSDKPEAAASARPSESGSADAPTRQPGRPRLVGVWRELTWRAHLTESEQMWPLEGWDHGEQVDP